MLGVFFLGFVHVASITICGGYPVWHGVDPLRAHLSGTHGWVSVTDCRWDDGDPDGWDCRGTFNGEGIAIEGIRLGHVLDEKPVNPVETVVSGPRADTAWAPGADLLLPIVAGTFMLSLLPAGALYHRLLGRRERAASSRQ